jgi:CRP-like cAMP-binding protein
MSPTLNRSISPAILTLSQRLARAEAELARLQALARPVTTRNPRVASRVAQCLQARPGLTRSDVARLCRLDVRAAGAAMDDLVRAGLATRTGVKRGTRWYLTEHK